MPLVGCSGLSGCGSTLPQNKIKHLHFCDPRSGVCLAKLRHQLAPGSGGKIGRVAFDQLLMKTFNASTRPVAA